MTLPQSVKPMNNKIMRLLICVCVTASACATVNVKDSSSLSSKRSEAFLFAAITTDIPNLTINIYQRNRNAANDFFSSASAVIKLRSGHNLIMIKLPAGYYTFKYVYPEDAVGFFELSDIIFRLEENVINYIGNLNIYKTTAYEIGYGFSDAYVADYMFLETVYPCLTKAYPVRKKNAETGNLFAVKRIF
ncbi:MAG: hypothetical protein LBL45_05095 [Treponema sp.]|jgi:hypothetical protein|nr:hypothetical protein [Treponema sp.]